MIQAKQFKTGNGYTRWGLVFLPDDYDATKSYPLIMFAHGIGEASWNSESETSLLYNHGVFAHLRGRTEWAFRHPLTKELHSFIVVAIQGHIGWSISPKEIDYALNEDILSTYNINANAIFITGLSAGGAVTLETITTPGIMENFSSAVPMSSAGTGNLANIKETAANNIRVWGFHGKNDKDLTNVWQTMKFEQALDAVKPGLFRGTYTEQGHGPWNQFYDPNYRESIGGKLMNIYEFFLLTAKDSAMTLSDISTKSGITTTTTTTTTTTKDIPFVLNTNQTLKTEGTSIELDASASTGWKVLWWEIIDKPAGSIASFGFKNYDSPIWKISNLSNGIYKLKLVGQDRYGTTKSLPVTLEVGTTTTTTTTTSTTTTTTTTKSGGGGGIDIPIDDDLNIPMRKVIKSVTIEYVDGTKTIINTI